MTTTQKCKHISRLLELLQIESKIANRLGAQGFSHSALQTNYERLSPSDFHWDSQASKLTYQYTVPSTHLFEPSTDLSLTPLLALIDDVTSWSSLLGDPQRQRFGVSINLRAEWAEPKKPTPGQELLIHTANNKIGKNIAFIDAKITDANSNQPIAFGSHVKYLDMGPIVNFAMSQQQGWPILRALVHRMDQSPRVAQWVQTLLPYYNPTKRPTGENDEPPIFHSLQFLDDHSGTFIPQSRHASMGGPLHGGCQACLLELIGNNHYEHKHAANNASESLRSIQVDYFNTPSRTRGVEIQVEPASSVSSKQLQAKIVSNGKVTSQANLTYT